MRTHIKFSPTINLMVRAVEKAARSLVRDFGEVENLQVSQKAPGNFVSQADLRSEKILVEELSKTYPDYGFLLEEGGEKKSQNASEYRWIIDPLDGTANFLFGIPHWYISLALEKGNEIIAGVIFDPIKDELFWAEKGQGAFMNNRRLKVAGRRQLDVAMIGTGIPTLSRKGQGEFIVEQELIMKKVAGLRRMGAAALDLCYVAAGRFDGFWEKTLSPWDIAAGALIVQEAGGIVTEAFGGNEYIYSGTILAGTPGIHPELLKLLKSAQKEKAA